MGYQALWSNDIRSYDLVNIASVSIFPVPDIIGGTEKKSAPLSKIRYFKEFEEISDRIGEGESLLHQGQVVSKQWKGQEWYLVKAENVTEEARGVIASPLVHKYTAGLGTGLLSVSELLRGQDSKSGQISLAEFGDRRYSVGFFRGGKEDCLQTAEIGLYLNGIFIAALASVKFRGIQ